MFDFDISRMIQEIALVAPGFLIAITVHEYMHGYIALRLGDPTAKMAGRLTFNPISHLDPIGTLVLVLTRIIGWAKPVPVDPRNLRNPLRDMLWISLGGPAANLIAATALALVFHVALFFYSSAGGETLSAFFLWPLVLMLRFAVVVNVGLAVFNMIPVHPLDGSSVLAGLLPRHLAYEYQKLEPYGFIILLALLFTRVVDYIVVPPIRFIAGILLQGPG
ncbi:MAG: site-2 protease family protein [Deltaproteobacteria bacterium]|nr:site-2 protease family protein [Deltaproteobacteria bacterium]